MITATPPHSRTPPPPHSREYTDFPHYQGEVIDIDSKNALGTSTRAVELTELLEDTVTPGTNNVPGESESGANEGGSGGTKKR